MSTLILPVAGNSSRFPGTRPKFLLTHPSGRPMLVKAVDGLLANQSFDSIIVVGLKEHEQQYNCFNSLCDEIRCTCLDLGHTVKCFKFLLDQPTQNQPETIVKVTEALRITGQIVIKDCDNYFEISEMLAGNFVGTYDLSKLSQVNAGNKAYVQFGKSGEIVNIVEKKVIGDKFCCGVYGFRDACEFVDYYHKLSIYPNLYISHIIYNMILHGSTFFAKDVSEYIDWGTMEDWNRFVNQYVALFIDIDGVLVESSAKHFDPKWGTTKGIQENVDRINALYKSGKYQIILTTTRDESFRAVTSKQLEDVGLLHYDELIMGLPHCKRVLINDFSNSNSYPSAIAINVPRNGKLGGLL